MGSTVEDLLDRMYYAATSERDKGDRFERFVQQFLRVDSTWSARFSNVWTWMEWPGRHRRPDTGIDLVAEERDTGELVAIQCKFYDPTRTVSKADIDSFLAASGQEPFRHRVIATTARWGSNADQAISGQRVPVQRLSLEDLTTSDLDWEQFDPVTVTGFERQGPRTPLPHQREAVDAVVEGFAAHDRGKLIMACGTGKTFTSLRIAERVVPAGGSVLFLVPSIALLSQTLREWAQHCEVPQRQFAVCSDTRVGRRTRAEQDEDITVVDLPLPATTDPARLAASWSTHGLSGHGQDRQARTTVVFATYQSIAVVADAQKQGLPEFDLIISDEAHRTTGTTLAGEEESAFVRVHDAAFISGRRRLYMTATPRIYGDTAKTRGREAQAVLASMDDETLFGPEFHRLGFGQAVARDLLSDYKVLVLAVDEASVARDFQAEFAADGELQLSDMAKIVGCWNGLAKKGTVEAGFDADPEPMRRAVAFSRSIKDSKRFVELFRQVVAADGVGAADAGVTAAVRSAGLTCEVEHVDGTDNILVRTERLEWLKADAGEGVCRVLSNARCLSEGVDVPALDAVMFLNPRKSEVDVVQSVGRVMRKAPGSGKRYGYIVLPIGVPAGVPPEQALRDNTKYAVVWEVLQALRAHDERFEAMINKIDLNADRGDRIQVIGVGDFGGDGGGDAASGAGDQLAMQLPGLGQWREALYARIVARVGSRRYWDQWATDVAEIAAAHRTRISALIREPGTGVRKEFDAFLSGLRGNLNDGISEADAVDMLAQHLITRPVFEALFEGYSFAEHNPVARVMQTMLDVLDANGLEAENASLQGFYESVRLRVSGIDNAEGKQRIVTELYEKFFKLAFAKTASSLGIVYTPVEIVDFILRAADDVLRQEFGTSLSDEGVHILDPFTGTGTFVVRLLQSGLIRPEDLARKYAAELHCNEILLLAYYIACVNIETTYQDLAGGEYTPFPGAVLVDTFQMTEDGDAADLNVFPVNNERVVAQNCLPIQVVIGNPPYSSGQESENDNNRNLGYPSLDAMIRRRWADPSTAVNKNQLYDSYIRAIRWATNRIGDRGVVAFVTNGGWLDSNSADAMRKSLADECSAVYVVNLRGNQRTAGEQSRREGGKVFGGGARTTVAIVLFVKRPEGVAGTIRYYQVDDYMTADQKLAELTRSSLESLPWRELTTNEHGDWLAQRDESFARWPSLGDLLDVHSAGLKTNRDAWVCNFSRADVEVNVRRMIDHYNQQVRDFQEQCRVEGVREPAAVLDRFIDTDATRISWSRSLKRHLLRNRTARFDADRVHVGAYRPFTKQHVYFQSMLNEMVYRLPSLFPTPEHENVGICLTGASSHYEFSVIATDALPNLHLLDTGQFFPRWTYTRADDLGLTLDGLAHAESDAHGYVRLDNVTDDALVTYRAAYGDDVTTDDVFHYVYGLLHSPDYRTRYAADLKKAIPRIPLVAATDDFRAFVDAGRDLMTLHLGYEACEPWPLHEQDTSPAGLTHAERYRVTRMKHPGTGRAKDLSTIVYNKYVTLSGIPPEAHEYLVGSRSALAWLIDRYQVRTDKASGIVNDPNSWSVEHDDPRYIIDLVKRVIRVSVETVRIVDALPELSLREPDAAAVVRPGSP